MPDRPESTLRELLQDARLTVHRLRTREHQLRTESAAALETIRMLVESTSSEDLLQRAIHMLQPLLGYADAFVLVQTEQGEGAAQATTRAGWPSPAPWSWQGPLSRAGEGRPVVLFDGMMTPEWQDRDPRDHEGVVSILYLPLRMAQHKGVLVCVHPDIGAFGPETVGLAKRLLPLLDWVLAAVGDWTERLDGQAREVSQATDSLAMANLHTKAILEAMVDGILVEDADGCIILVNPAWTRIFQIADVQSVVGVDFDALTSRARGLFADPAGFLAKMGAARANPALVGDTLTTRDGRVLEWSTRSVHSGDQAVGRLWVCRDITQRVLDGRRVQEARERAEHAVAAKNEFLASVSHEIRTPLNAIMGMTELVMGMSLAPEQAELLRAVRTASAQLHHMLSDLLDFSKLETRTVELRRERFDIGRLCEEVVAGVAVSAQRRRVGLSIAVTPAARCTLGDRERICQIVTNLVSCAVHHAAGGTVQVRVDGEDHELIIEIEDSSQATPGDPRDTIFGRVAPGGAPPSAGASMTLGLGISRRLAEQMGGFIRFRRAASPATHTVLHLPGARMLTGGPPRETPLAGRTVGVALPPPQRAAVATQVRNLAGQCVLLPPDGLGPPLALPDCNVLLVPPGWRPETLDAVRARGTRVLVCLPPGGAVPLHVDGHVHWPVTRQDLVGAALVGTDHSVNTVQQGVHILLAEDDRNNRVVAEHFLKSAGHRVTVATTGTEAVALGRNPTIDLILMDVQMPELDGLGAVRQLRASDRPWVPVLALTAHATPAIQAACLAAGMNGFLNKPIARDTLLHAIDAWVGDAQRILVIDDDASARQVLELRLRKADQQFIELADSGVQGLAQVARWRPHLIFLDLEMPDMDGHQVLAMLRRVEQTEGQRFRVVAVTGQAAVEAPPAGFDGMLHKPLRQDAIAQLVQPSSPPAPPRAAPSPVAVSIDADLMPLIPGYLADVRTATAQLEQALDQQDHAAIRDIAHRFKGTGSAYGFPFITDIASRMEHAATDSAGGPPTGGEDLKALHQELCTWLDALVVHPRER